jgi:hypothetical protein
MGDIEDRACQQNERYAPPANCLQDLGENQDDLVFEFSGHGFLLTKRGA